MSRRSRKGVSAIVGSLIMAATVVSIGLILLSSGLGTFSSYTSNVYLFTTSSIQKVQERFLVENVWFTTNQSFKVIRIYIYNYGKIPITIDTVYINDTYVPISPVSVDIGDNGVATFTYFWRSGETFKIKIVSTRGNEYESFWKAY